MHNESPQNLEGEEPLNEHTDETLNQVIMELSWESVFGNTFMP